MSIQVTLTQNELTWCASHAHHRSEPKLSGHRWGKKSYDAHLMGICGELSCVKVIPTAQMNTRIYGAQGDGADADLTFFANMTAEVKTRDKRGYDFALSGTDRSLFRDTFGILCWMETVGVVEVARWITAEEFRLTAWEKDYGHGLRAVVTPEQMHPIEDLVGWFVEKIPFKTSYYA